MCLELAYHLKGKEMLEKLKRSSEILKLCRKDQAASKPYRRQLRILILDAMSLVDHKISPGKFLEVTLLAADNFEACNHHVKFSLHQGQTII